MALSPERLRASMSVGSADTIAFTRSNSPALIASMKAALLEVVSGMHRFYPACGPAAGLKACTTTAAKAGAEARVLVVQTFRSAVIATAILIAGTAQAQTTPAPAPPPEPTAQPSPE